MWCNLKEKIGFFLSTQKAIARFTAQAGKIQTERPDVEILPVVKEANDIVLYKRSVSEELKCLVLEQDEMF